MKLKRRQLDASSHGSERKIAFDKIFDDVYRDKNRLLSHFLDPYSLGNGQFQILNEIGWEEGISQEKIASLRKIDKSAVAKSVKRLIEDGYIYKIRDENDKRAYCLYCTEKGKKMIPVIKNIIIRVDKILTGNSTPEELEVFVALTRRMSENIEDYLRQ